MSTPAAAEILPDSVAILPPPVFLSEGRLWSLAPDLVFDEASFEVRLRDQAIPLQPQVVELIGFLVHNHGRLVTKAELIRGPWRGTCVTESALHRAVMLARRALQQAGHGSLIATVRGRGFRLKAVGPMSVRPSPAPVSSTSGPGRSRPDDRRLVGSRVLGESGGSEVWELRTVATAQRIGILSCVRQGSSTHVTCTVRRGTSRSDLSAFIEVVVPSGGGRRTLVIAEHEEHFAVMEAGAPSPHGGVAEPR